MLYILWYSLVVILLKPTRIYPLSAVETLEDDSKFTSDNEQLSKNVESSQENNFDENVEEYNENAGYERAEMANDALVTNNDPVIESSSKNRLDPDVGLLLQDETNAGLEPESLSQSHDSESYGTDLNQFERDFISDSPSTIEQKPTHQIDTEEKSEFYQSSVNGHASPSSKDGYQLKLRAEEDNFQPLDSEATQASESQLIDTEEKSEFYQSYGNRHASPVPESSYHHTQRADENDFQPPDAQVNRVSESQLIEPEDTLSDHDRTERSFTEINEEARLNSTGESFVIEADRTIQSKPTEQAETDGNINERTALADARENIARELAVKTKLKLKEYSEAEDNLNFNEGNNFNQISESIISESTSSVESNSTPQAELEDAVKPISHNVLNANSYFVEDDTKKSFSRDENQNFRLFNSPVTKVNQDNMNGAETKKIYHVSDLNTHGESEPALQPLQRTKNKSKNNLSNNFELFNDEALPEEKSAYEEKFIPNNAFTDDSSEYYESLLIRNIDSEHTDDDSSFPSESNKPVDISNHPYSTHNINYLSEEDTLLQNNIEQATVEDSHDLIDSFEEKTNDRNQKESVTCKTINCLRSATAVDHESNATSSKLSPNIQKKVSIRKANSNLENAMDFTVVRNDSDHQDNLGTFEYLENIEFNLHEVLHIIKTDRNLRAFILNSVILYFPVLICDVLLWIVIVKLVRHIRRQLVSNQYTELTESLDVQKDESEDVDLPNSDRLTPREKSKRSGKGSDDDFEDSSSEFLCISSKRKEWYPPS